MVSKSRLTSDHKPLLEAPEEVTVVVIEEVVVATEHVVIDHLPLEEAVEVQEAEEEKAEAVEEAVVVKEVEVEEPMPKETQSDKETKEKAETDTPVMNPKSTVDTTEKMVPVEEEEEVPREVLESSTKVPDQKVSTRRGTLKVLFKMPKLNQNKKRRRKRLSHNMRKSSTVSHGMTTSVPTQKLEPRKVEMSRVSQRMSRPKPTTKPRFMRVRPRL